MANTEDIPYEAPAFTMPDEAQEKPDVDQPNKSVLVEVVEELKNDIAVQKSFDSVNLPNNATREQKIAAYDEIAIHKGLALHLEKYKIMIETKIKELK